MNKNVSEDKVTKFYLKKSIQYFILFLVVAIFQTQMTVSAYANIKKLVHKVPFSKSMSKLTNDYNFWNVDYNADGFLDVWIEPKNNNIFIANKTNIVLPISSHSPWVILNTTSGAKVIFNPKADEFSKLNKTKINHIVRSSDINGDKQAEWIYLTNNTDGWIAEFSNGSFKIIRNLKALIEEDHQWSIEDANGDLFNDIVVRNKNDREISIVYGKENSSLEIQGINSSLRIQALNAVAPSVASDVQSAELPATALGGLVGQPQVAASGNFQYNIPIPIPPVEGKIQPNLQILYDSSAQVSELGIGFRLNAGSTITRCPKTRSTDGENLPVAYDSSDAFCLDGQRLLHVGGNRYIAEMGNDIIEIRAEGVLASGPTSFKVYFNNGRLATFGADANSRLIRSDGQTSSHGVSPLNPIFSWAISSMEDNFGHRVNYFYYLDTLKGIQRLSEITYDNYKILFFYKTPRWQQDYSTSDPFLTAPQVLATGGPVIRYGNLLTRVEVHGLAGLINVNHLRYDFSSQTKGDSLIKHQLAKLISIQQCSLQRCQKPTHFSWPEETAAINTRYSAWGNKYNSVNMLSVHVQHVQWGDFNGDGVNDIYYISGKRGFNDPIADQDKIYITQPDQTQVEWNGLKTFSFDAHRRLIFADFNGDGITDIYYGGNGSDYERGGDTVEVTNQNDTGKIYFSQGNGSFVIKEGPKISWANSNLRIRVGDFNGDGIQDIYHIRGAQGTVQSNAIYLFESDGSYQTVVVQGYPLSNTSEWIGEDLKGYVFADFNGDGITDLYKHNIERGAHNISGGRIDRIYQFNSSGQIGSTWDVQDIQYSMRIYDGDNPATASADLSRFKWQDFNGDGRTDVYYLEGDGSSSIDKIYISLGNGRFTVFNGITKFMPSTAPDQSVESGRYQLTDWNGDGLVDIHRLPARGQNTQTEVFLAQPFQDKWFAEAPLKTNFTFLVDGDRELARYDFSRLQYVDFNADGRSDIYETRRWESLNLYNMAHIATASPRLISAITNSSNSKLEVNYSALTTKKNYIFEAKANSYPFRHTLFPLFTVSSFKNDNGMGGQQEYQYAYEKSLSHIDYGWLGFGKIIQTNNIELQNHSSITGEPSITKVKEINTTNYIQDPVQRLTGSVQETSRSVGGVNIQRAYFEYQTQNNLVNGLKQFFPKTTRSQTATWDLKGFFTGNNQKIWTYDLNKLISQNECNIGANPANIQIIIPCLNTTIWIKNISTNHEYLLDFARAYSDGTSLVDNSLIAKTSVIKRANSAYTSEHSLPWPAHALMKHQENTLYQYQAGTGLLNNLTTTDGLDVMQTKTVFAYSPKGFLLQKKQLGVDFPVRNLYFSYDEQSRLTKQTNALGHETFQYYEDARFPWKVTSSTDVNGLKAYSAYDDFGAVKQTTNALGIITTVEQDFCSAGCQAGEVSWKKTQSIGVPTQWEWFDAFDRVVRKQSSGWLGLIESRTLYNPEGHVAAQSTPRYLNEPELFKTINYDALDRIVQERTSNGSIQTQNYTGLQTEMFDANWHAAGGLAFPSATQYMDPQGLLLKVVDASGADIQYAYDVRGLNARTQLTSNLIIDNFYNWAGHKIKSQHP
ncbi:MAG: FG-GAP-like repeat-containing protein, partial [Pseudomonadota bacterium]